MTEKIHYRMVDDGIEPPRRYRVVVFYGFEGYVVRWTDACSGCTESCEYAILTVGAGCKECGYTGKRRCDWFVPFPENHAAYERFLDTRYVISERVRKLREHFTKKAA